MVLTKEFRICMPMTVEEYRIGQLYMVARHSYEQSGNGEGVEVIANNPITDPVNGSGQYTEKRIHLSSHLPYWVQSLIPKVFYITEKAWNFYPYTITEYTCSFIPKFSVSIQTRFEDNNGTTENCLHLTEEELSRREVQFIDIANDEVKPHHYKEAEDPKFFKSQKTGRGPLTEDWKDTCKPIMCCYKAVHVKFEVWGLQTKVEEYIQGAIFEILLLGHRQAFTWMDEWYEMTIEDVRAYEREMQIKTNNKMKSVLETPVSGSIDEEEPEAKEEPEGRAVTGDSPKSETSKSPKAVTDISPSQEAKSWFSWS